ncbi:hypothetical protein P7L53_02140 [Thermoleptolyngbya sichuanensis XZ-Cy5]|uniref:hypothetical protein n=1 Tax=Thermoleptolyngbya sichuanensis TaxID=2885951 RepID=UPI00240E4406|nr:hypothetical protein [Thermoleptolyngbya sichuanensis]MDG2615035.1 hypothetical protein [Thermoleptolyngbya sichuanensis XZ-Cy5]
MTQSLRSPFPHNRSASHPWQRVALLLASLPILAISGCETPISTQYQATATTTYTWLVEYEGANRPGERPPRIEEFASTSLENRNGQKPEGAVTGPDDKGLWWPALPPKPTIDDIEARQQRQERPGTPRLNKTVNYTITFRRPGEDNRTLPTRYEVYRQVVKAYEDRIPLEFTLDPAERTVLKATP